MQVDASYTWPDGSTIEISCYDGIDGFDPLRLRDMSREVMLVLGELRGEPAVDKKPEP